MWYRLSQLGTTIPALLTDPTVSNLASGKNKFFVVENNIKKLIDSLQPEKQLQFKNRLESLKQSNSLPNFNTSEDRTESWNNLLKDVSDQVYKQNINSVNYIKSVVNNRMFGRYENNNFIDADKLFKEYLNAQANFENISNMTSSSDIYEIAKFFISQATDPKYNIVKNIIKNFPQKYFKYAEVVDLLLNFYFESKLTEVKEAIEQKQPLSQDAKLAIDFINSKIMVHSAKIGISIFNITNKNIFGQLLGSVGSLAAEGVQGLQNQMKVDQSIQQLLNRSGQ